MTGNPYPDFDSATLYFENEILTSQRLDDLDIEFKRPISFFPVKLEQAGMYTVKVSNSKGSANTSFLVTVQSM